MEILVSGSLAYARIMDFPGLFSDHILPEKIHMINVSFTVNGLTEKFGGTAGNIAYALSLLGENPRILATIGQDYHRYFQWLEERGIGTDSIRVIPEEFTAGAYITTDNEANQITGFNPGSMKHPSEFDVGTVNVAECIAIVAPGNLQDMAEYALGYQQRGVFCIFDPGQSLPAWNGADLASTIGRANMLVSNDYELEMITNSTGLSVDQILDMVDTIITTKGEHGCEVITRNAVAAIPAIPTAQAVDPTGAGDAFRGGLIKGLVLDLTVERAAQMGTVCSHYAIQTYGTQEYGFTLDEFTTTLERNFGKVASA